VTVTTPSVRIANIELPTYRFIDEVFNKNFLGKQVQIFIGYTKYSSTSTDMVQVFDGTVEDIEFDVDNNDISLILRGQNVPKYEVQGRKIDYTSNEVGGALLPSLENVDSDDVRYIPMLFGTHEFAPGVCIDSGMQSGND